MNPTLITRAERDTVQDIPDAKRDNGATASGFWVDAVTRGDLLPSYATTERARWLRAYDRNDFNTLWRSARANLVKKYASTEYQLSGGRNLTHLFDDVLRYSQFGAGSQQLRALLGRDFLRYDHGAYMEIIAPGNPMRPPTGRVTGLAYLDAYNCIPTGDPQYPVLYTSTKGKSHLLHYTRVVQFVDSPDGDQTKPGYGECALSRAVAVISRQILMGKYVVTQLDDKPPPGMLLVSGMGKQQWDAAWANYKRDQATDERPEWGKVIPIFGADAALTPSIESVGFSTPPEKFDYKVYVELDVHELALAIGVDIQELWELTSGNLGSQGQSQIQHVKSQGKTLGQMLSAFERAMNNYVLPESLEFEFKVRDPYEAQERAQHAQIWSGIAMQLVPLIGNQLAAEILTNQVEAVADALLDENGQMVRLPDADRQEPEQSQETDATVDDTTPQTSDGGQEPTTTPDAAPTGGKAFDDTRAAFTQSFTDLVQGALQDDLNRRRAGIVLRAQLNRLGKQAYEDGLKAGGVEDGMAQSDRAAFAVWLAQQSGYVTGFLDEVYKQGLTDAEVALRADMWANKSLQTAYYLGVLSADANGMYAFVGTDGIESCSTCRSLKGTKMRMSEWAEKRLRPGVDTENYECGGWECYHRLKRVGQG